MAKIKPWMLWAVRIAAACHLSLGLWLVLRAPVQPYVEYWQMIGVFTALIGIGQALAGGDPVRHWAVIFLSLLFDCITPYGLFLAARTLHFPMTPVWFVAWIWVVPYGAILAHAYQSNRARRVVASPEVQRFALRARTQYEISLFEMSQISPVLVVFLRHFGCTFCRQTLSELRVRRTRIEEGGVRVALVHMADEKEAAEFLISYDLGDLPRVGDPRQSVYRAFGLNRGNLLQLFGLRTWIRGFQSVVLEGNLQGRTVGDSFQMPGVFLIFHGEVLKSYRHQSPADRPNYVALALDQDYPVPS